MFTFKKILYSSILLLIIVLANSLYAVKPRSSTHKTKNQFERGTFKDISILDKGIITLAPKKQKIIDSRGVSASFMC